MPVVPLSAAAPTVEIDGAISDRIPGLMVSLSVIDTIDGLSSAELVLHNAGARNRGAGYLFFDRDELDFGSRLTVYAGAGDGAGRIFDGYVSALRGEFPGTGTPRLGVHLEDRLQDLRMTRRTRTFEDVDDATAIQQIASDHGLTPRVSLDGPTHRVLAQLNQSDLAFIRGRAEVLGAEVWMEGDELHVARRPDRGGDPIVLSFRQNLRELTVAADLAHQRTGVSVTGWDVSAKEAIDAEVADSVLSSELAGLTSGPGVLTQAFGDRLDQLADLAPRTTEEARAYAEAHFLKTARGFVRGDALVDGDARIKVGAVVELAGVGPLFNGAYVVSATRHMFDVGLGYRTLATVERMGIGS